MTSSTVLVEPRIRRGSLEADLMSFDPFSAPTGVEAQLIEGSALQPWKII